MFALLKWYVLSFLLDPTRATRALGTRVGQGCRIYTSKFGSEPWLISIGDRVTVTAGVRFITHDGATWLVHDEKGRRCRYAPIEIGDDVFIGSDALILPGVRIGSRCIIAAGSVVSKSVPSGSVVAGVPARVIGLFDDYARKAEQTFRLESEMLGSSYRERVNSVLTTDPVKQMPKAVEPIATTTK